MNFFNNSGHDFGGCGCGSNNGCDCISLLIWIILLQCLCGGNNSCGIDCCTLIILLLLCGCGNNSSCK